MKWIGVITGDIVGSSEILKAGERDKLLEVMHEFVKEINATEKYGNVRMEIFRGDSFQIIINNGMFSLLLALAFRAKLIANSSDSLRWDARLGIGIGKGEYLVDSIAESDGEAFHLSGKVFEELDKNSRMAILTPDHDFNHELVINTSFADDIVSNWTVVQSLIFYLMSIESKSQKEIAKKLDRTPQTISKTFGAGKIILIFNYYNRFIDKIHSLNPPSHDHP